MEIVIVADDDAVGRVAASVIVERVRSVPTSVIGLATGSSPLSTYRHVVDAVARADVTFSDATAVTLDEYVGLASEHPESYRNVIVRDLVGRIDLPLDRLHSPDTAAACMADACERHDELLTRLGVDVQLLGIGTDGHIAFNEPGSSLTSRTRIKTLTDRTREDNARFFSSIDEVPRHVVTQGLGTISDARHLVLVASGAHKAAPIRSAVEGPLTASCPASIIQLHRHATVVVDEAAAADLERSDYYRATHRYKPSWQQL